MTGAPTLGTLLTFLSQSRRRGVEKEAARSKQVGAGSRGDADWATLSARCCPGLPRPTSGRPSRAAAWTGILTPTPLGPLAGSARRRLPLGQGNHRTERGVRHGSVSVHRSGLKREKDQLLSNLPEGVQSSTEASRFPLQGVIKEIKFWLIHVIFP